mmetsp:Transcript_4532/g.11218  ORF Transcript_4532/g.11218 Transcript_4532/m.11218 type:complete len:200 (+) Transcript_4532:377-976(+)
MRYVAVIPRSCFSIPQHFVASGVTSSSRIRTAIFSMRSSAMSCSADRMATAAASPSGAIARTASPRMPAALSSLAELRIRSTSARTFTRPSGVVQSAFAAAEEVEVSDGVDDDDGDVERSRRLSVTHVAYRLRSCMARRAKRSASVSTNTSSSQQRFSSSATLLVWARRYGGVGFEDIASAAAFDEGESISSNDSTISC